MENLNQTAELVPIITFCFQSNFKNSISDENDHDVMIYLTADDSYFHLGN